MSGASVTLGTDVDLVFNPTFVGIGQQSFSYKAPAGSYLAVVVAAGSMVEKAFSDVRSRLYAVGRALQSGDGSQYSTLTRERVLGDLFQAGLLSYYALKTAQLAGLTQAGRHHLAAGLGSFGYEPNVDSFFGIPRSITTGGVAMNMPTHTGPVSVPGWSGAGYVLMDPGIGDAAWKITGGMAGTR